MRRRTTLAAAVLLAGTSSLLAQSAPVGPGTPNGLSGPGGTETFSATPTVPNLSAPGSLGGVTSGRIGSRPSGATPALRPVPKRR